MTSSTDSKPTRPLSPHLQVYKPQITSVLSITHRLCGIALSFGVVVMVIWLATLAKGPEAYGEFASCAQSMIGQIVLVGLSFAFFFHLCCGIRHLFWDAGYFLDIKDVYNTGYVVVLAAALLTAIVWLKIYGVTL